MWCADTDFRLEWGLAESRGLDGEWLAATAVRLERLVESRRTVGEHQDAISRNWGAWHSCADMLHSSGSTSTCAFISFVMSSP